jgi:hypothetical protein
MVNSLVLNVIDPQDFPILKGWFVFFNQTQIIAAQFDVMNAPSLIKETVLLIVLVEELYNSLK